MKFNNLFTLLLASSAFAYHIQRRDELGDAGQTLNQSIDANPAASPAAANTYAGTTAANNSTTSYNNADPISFIENEFKSSNTKECQELHDAFSKCVIFNFGKSFDAGCVKFDTPECQEVVKKDFSGCELSKGNPGVILATIRVYCAKDENGKLCPFTEGQRKEEKQFIDENILKETTKSKACTEHTILSLKEIKNTCENSNELIKLFTEEDKKQIENFDKYISILSESKNNESSGATPLKVGSALLVSFIALLLSRF
ncbi:hypothetical protein PIROE2DRAFT_64690 [Piromyces sp. E2]|nr:hypothetical protein PIROE2DRAFT_64690 [Piromyces sp. E2]|eukprot:OUM57979.1 hypothetical protein PIROE2DRAFT_64690 [Piromyces sp. E2]